MRMIDLHCDTLWQMDRDKSIKLKRNACAVDIEKLKAVGAVAQFFACFIYMDDFQGEKRYAKGYQKALHMIARAKEEFRDCEEDIALTRSFSELVSHEQDGRISAFLTIEEGGIIDGDIKRLDALYEQGVRLMTLLWNYENCMGYPNSRDASVMQSGLKAFGFSVLERMNELGMLIDVSHMSDGGFWDVIKHSRQPVVASHSNVRKLCNHPRNLSDEMIRALAEKGGVQGLNLYPYFLHESGKVTVSHMVSHLKHMYQVGGEDVVAIGTDFDGFDEGESDITHIGQMEKLYHALNKSGFTERQLEKFWCKNALRVMKEVFL